MKVKELKGVWQYLESRNISERYLRVKISLEAGRYQQVQFKKRKPNNKNVFQFRITDKYRAICLKKEDYIIVPKSPTTSKNFRRNLIQFICSWLFKKSIEFSSFKLVFYATFAL